GAVYVIDRGNLAIRKLELPSGAVSTVAHLPGDHNLPRFGLSWDGHGHLYYIEDDLTYGVVRRVDVKSGAVDLAWAGERSLGRLIARAADDAGNLYLGNRNAIVRLALAAGGALTTIAGTPGMPGASDGSAGRARFDYIHALVWDGAGVLYVADDSAIRK